MRVPSASISMIQRHASERLSCRIPNHSQYSNNQNNYQYQQNYQNPQFVKQQSNYQPVNKNHQNQLAAAAAAAAAVSLKKSYFIIKYTAKRQKKIFPN